MPPFERHHPALARAEQGGQPGDDLGQLRDRDLHVHQWALRGYEGRRVPVKGMLLASVRPVAYSRASEGWGTTPFARVPGTRRGGDTPMAEAERSTTRDEEKLAELGYEQELTRGWSQFANFAISFSIISVLAGCFTLYGQAWQFGGPIAISWGWPILCLLILTVAVSMSELTSAYPTAGGPYWWAHRLGGPGWSWFTGWFNVVGLIGVVASVDYLCAFFVTSLFGLWGWDLGFVNFGDDAARSGRDLLGVRTDRGHPRPDQHLFGPPGGAVQQHLGVLARGRDGGDHRHPDHRSGPASERRLRLHRAAQPLRLPHEHVLVVHPARRVPADHLHDHRLRRLRARGRGDP